MKLNVQLHNVICLGEVLPSILTSLFGTKVRMTTINRHLYGRRVHFSHCYMAVSVTQTCSTVVTRISRCAETRVRLHAVLTGSTVLTGVFLTVVNVDLAPLPFKPW